MFQTDSLPTVHLTHLCLNRCKRLVGCFITFQNHQDTNVLVQCIWTLLLKQNSAPGFVFSMGSLSESFIQKLQVQPPQSRTSPFSQTSAPTRGTPPLSLKHSSQQFNCTTIIQVSTKNQLVAFTQAKHVCGIHSLLEHSTSENQPQLRWFKLVVYTHQHQEALLEFTANVTVNTLKFDPQAVILSWKHVECWMCFFN